MLSERVQGWVVLSTSLSLKFGAILSPTAGIGCAFRWLFVRYSSRIKEGWGYESIWGWINCVVGRPCQLVRYHICTTVVSDPYVIRGKCVCQYIVLKYGNFVISWKYQKGFRILKRLDNESLNIVTLLLSISYEQCTQ